MPTSFPRAAEARARRDGEAGFTLVELMVVLALIGLAAGAVVLALPREDAAAVRQAGDALAVRIAAARDQAVIGQRDVAVRFDEAGYGFATRRADGGWVAAPATLLDGRAWPDGARARASTERIAFDAVGLPDRPGWVRLAPDGAAGTAIIVRVSAGGDVSVGRE